jgi:D-alanyl-D-alanine dipeptidase
VADELGELPFLQKLPSKIVADSLPPLEDGWVELLKLDSTIAIDIRYATDQNFVGTQMYPCARCILRTSVAKSLIEVHRSLRAVGMGLKVFDCYRPWSIQDALWQKMPDARYVTPPEKGSMHNRGAAVDLTLIDENGHELDMGTVYDFFGEEAYHTFTQHPQSILARRKMLRELMAEAGFKHIRTEWWHYSFQLEQYEISDYRWPCGVLVSQSKEPW